MLFSKYHSHVEGIMKLRGEGERWGVRGGGDQLLEESDDVGEAVPQHQFVGDVLHVVGDVLFHEGFVVADVGEELLVKQVVDLVRSVAFDGESGRGELDIIQKNNV